MALLRLLKSGNFTVVKVAILGSLKSDTDHYQQLAKVPFVNLLNKNIKLAKFK